MSIQLATLTVLGKRKSRNATIGSVRLVGSDIEPSCSEQSDFDYQPEPSGSKTATKPVLINGKLSFGTKKRFQCTYSGCNKAYAKPSRLAEHERSHTGERPFVCDTCQKAYLRESHLHAHARSHLPESSRPLACDVEGCEKRFWTSQHLKVHKDWHNGAKLFACNEDGCSEAFAKHHQLRAHYCRTHAPPGTQPYICDHEGCSKSFPTNQKLKAHKKTHEPNRYTCVDPACMSTGSPTFFATWSALQHHLRTVHLPTCPHPSCVGRTFTSQKNMKAHFKLHDERDLDAKLHEDPDSDAEADEPLAKKPRRGGETGRDWKCDFQDCGKDFKSKKAMVTHHNVTHLGQRKFVCTECDKSFGYKHLLQRHTAKVHAASDSDGDDEGTADESDALINSITGKAYANKAQSTVAQGRALFCPFPEMDGLNNFPSISADDKPCEYVYSRLYDLRRHLDTAHGIETSKEELENWVLAKKRAHKM